VLQNKSKYIMGKDSEKNLVGQPIFKQIIKILPRDKFDELVLRCKSDRYYKSFFFPTLTVFFIPPARNP
jgi:hypothetical protein